jgi:hypothetical protein
VVESQNFKAEAHPLGVHLAHAVTVYLRSGNLVLEMLISLRAAGRGPEFPVQVVYTFYLGAVFAKA